MRVNWRDSTPRYQSKELKILNISFPQVEMEPTTCRFTITRLINLTLRMPKVIIIDSTTSSLRHRAYTINVITTFFVILVPWSYHGICLGVEVFCQKWFVTRFVGCRQLVMNLVNFFVCLYWLCVYLVLYCHFEAMIWKALLFTFNAYVLFY